MNRTVTGWIFVAIQGLLLGMLVVLPGWVDWPTPTWLLGLGLALIVGGLAVIAISSVRLGPALTATPVPTERGVLATSGLYRYVRHPIYSGVLAIVVGLAERYEDYTDFAAVTPRFIPQPWRGRAGTTQNRKRP